MFEKRSQCETNTCVEFLDQSTQTVDVSLLWAGPLFNDLWSSPSVKAGRQGDVLGGFHTCTVTTGHTHTHTQREEQSLQPSALKLQCALCRLRPAYLGTMKPKPVSLATVNVVRTTLWEDRALITRPVLCRYCRPSQTCNITESSHESCSTGNSVRCSQGEKVRSIHRK